MPASAEMSQAEQAELRDRCTVFLGGHGPVTAAGLLAALPPTPCPTGTATAGL